MQPKNPDLCRKYRIYTGNCHVTQDQGITYVVYIRVQHQKIQIEFYKIKIHFESFHSRIFTSCNNFQIKYIQIKSSISNKYGVKHLLY